MKLRAFIGSSSENLNVANALKHNLAKELEYTLWNDYFFKLPHNTLETLINRVDEFESVMHLTKRTYRGKIRGSNPI